MSGTEIPEVTIGAVARGCRVLALVIELHLAGCREEDRILTASCATSNGWFVSAFNSTYAGDTAIGAVNIRNDNLGTIVRVASDASVHQGLRWAGVYTLRSPQTTVTSGSVWLSPRMQAQFRANVDGDTVLESSRAEIERILQQQTRMAAVDVQRVTITNLLGTINDEPTALAVLRDASEMDHYLVLSSIVFANDAALYFDAEPLVSWGAFRRGRSYFHVKYDCPIRLTRDQSSPRNARVPTVYFYMAVRYDRANNRAQLDPRVTGPVSVGLNP